MGRKWICEIRREFPGHKIFASQEGDVIVRGDNIFQGL
jgi:hypothetical protein